MRKSTCLGAAIGLALVAAIAPFMAGGCQTENHGAAIGGMGGGAISGALMGYAVRSPSGAAGLMGSAIGSVDPSATGQAPATQPAPESHEQYNRIVDNPFLAVADQPLSTFSIDVDTASYTNVRRLLNAGTKPPPDAVRIEELVNYFTYPYADPQGEHPLAIRATVTECPWKPEHRLARIALQAKHVPAADAPPANLVFLIDVSGSMQSDDKLPLLIYGMKQLVEQLRPTDRVAIVTYAGNESLALESTPASESRKIIAALDSLGAGGSTAGAAGIQLAYKVAGEHLIKGGNNRVILATDGDFNVGVADNSALVRLIEEKRKGGVFLSVLGFGTGNLNDAMMERVADAGNGNYNYVDSQSEARRVLVGKTLGTLLTVAKDVKLQVEFNPAKVAGYRLIGYENRMLATRDFKDDAKDAGEVGSGHSVTALYEIVPAGRAVPGGQTDPLRYQAPAAPTTASTSDELLTVNVRYKLPDADTSVPFSAPLRDEPTVLQGDAELRLAVSAAGFGMLLRDSPHKGSLTWAGLDELAKGVESGAKSEEEMAARKEFRELIGKARKASEKP